MTKSVFTTSQVVSIDRVNYGGHVGHDSLITMMHQARIDFLASINQSEIKCYESALIMKSLTVNYHQQLFCGDELLFEVKVSAINKLKLTLLTKVYKNNQCVADASMDFLSFDYQAKKLVRFNTQAISALTALITH